ncbi:hypothetical protein BaRGS_00017547, partial [Batillaria attramentaria]
RAMVRLKMKNRGGLVRFSPDDFYRDVTEDEALDSTDGHDDLNTGFLEDSTVRESGSNCTTARRTTRISATPVTSLLDCTDQHDNLNTAFLGDSTVISESGSNCNTARNERIVSATPIGSFDVDNEASSGEEYVPDFGSADSTDSYTEDDVADHFQFDPSLKPSSTTAEPTSGAAELSTATTEQLPGTAEPSAGTAEPSTATARIRVVCTSNTADRNYDKKQFCMFCAKGFSKLPRHLEQAHSQEPEVAKLTSIKDDKQRNTELMRLRNIGNYRHNCAVLREGKGDLVVVYRPKTATPYTQYSPCDGCLGFFTKTELWRHTKHCKLLSSSGARGSAIRRSSCLLETNVCLNQGLANVMSRLKADDVSCIIRGDRLIMMLAERQYNRHGHSADQHEHIRRDLRLTARLLQELRKQHGDSNSLSDFMQARNYKDIVRAARACAEFDEMKNCFRHPSVAIKVGQLVQTCAQILRSEANQQGVFQIQDNASRLIQCFSDLWETDVASHARRNTTEKKREKVLMLPATKDVQLLSKHIYAVGAKAFEELSKGNISAYGQLRDCTLLALMTFNRRRQGEVSRMKTKDVSLKRNAPNEDIMTSLSSFEKQLVMKLARLEIRGKRGRTVPLILNSTMQEWLAALFRARQAAGVLESNPFLFARSGTEDTHVRGADLIRKFGNECGAKNPNSLRSTLLRKHVATTSQILNLRDNELDHVADFLGHNILVHREYYRLPDETIQLAKVSKLLFCMERGNVPGLKGKNLDDIQVETGEGILDGGEEDVIGDSEGEGEESQTAVNVPSHDGLEIRQEEAGASSHSSRKRRHGEKRQWGTAEQEAVHKIFFENISTGNLPGKAEILEAQRVEPSLGRRSWQNVKDYIRNAITRNSKKLKR